MNELDLIVIGEVRNAGTVTPDTQAPSVLSELSAASVTSNSFTLNWTASTDNVGVTGYEVFRAGTRICTPMGNSFNLTGLAASTTYSMTVLARDAAGNFSQPSAALRVTTASGADTQAPTVPTNLRSSNITSTSFTVSCTPSTDNVGVREYRIFSGGSQIGAANTTSHSLSSLAAGTYSSITVRA